MPYRSPCECRCTLENYVRLPKPDDYLMRILTCLGVFTQLTDVFKFKTRNHVNSDLSARRDRRRIVILLMKAMPDASDVLDKAWAQCELPPADFVRYASSVMPGRSGSIKIVTRVDALSLIDRDVRQRQLRAAEGPPANTPRSGSRRFAQPAWRWLNKHWSGVLLTPLNR